MIGVSKTKPTIVIAAIVLNFILPHRLTRPVDERLAKLLPLCRCPRRRQLDRLGSQSASAAKMLQFTVSI
jgi:hypothetical protein